MWGSDVLFQTVMLEIPNFRRTWKSIQTGLREYGIKVGKHINLNMPWDCFFWLTCFYSLAGKRKNVSEGMVHRLDSKEKGESQDMGHMRSVNHHDRNIKVIWQKQCLWQGPRKERWLTLLIPQFLFRSTVFLSLNKKAICL